MRNLLLSLFFLAPLCFASGSKGPGAGYERVPFANPSTINWAATNYDGWNFEDPEFSPQIQDAINRAASQAPFYDKEKELKSLRQVARDMGQSRNTEQELIMDYQTLLELVYSKNSKPRDLSESLLQFFQISMMPKAAAPNDSLDRVTKSKEMLQLEKLLEQQQMGQAVSTNNKEASSYWEKQNTIRFNIENGVVMLNGTEVSKNFLKAFWQTIPELLVDSHKIVDAFECKKISKVMSWASLMGIQVRQGQEEMWGLTEWDFKQAMRLYLTVGNANEIGYASCNDAHYYFDQMWPDLVGKPWMYGVRITGSSGSEKRTFTQGKYQAELAFYRQAYRTLDSQKRERYGYVLADIVR